MTTQNNKKLEGELLALFAFIMKYKNDKEFKKLLVMYKQHREELKDYVGKMYLGYIKDNQLNMTYREINKEIKKLESKLTVIGNNLKKQENTMLSYILYKVYEDSYCKSNDIIGGYKKTMAMRIRLMIRLLTRL